MHLPVNINLSHIFEKKRGKPFQKGTKSCKQNSGKTNDSETFFLMLFKQVEKSRNACIQDSTQNNIVQVFPKQVSLFFFPNIYYL